MCGIVAIFHLDGRPVESKVLDRMTASLSHRGPDDHRIWVDGNIGIGHRRLAVFDTSPAGAQPMPSGGGEWMLGYNGALYDYLQRRPALEACGYVFRGNSDTEVIANSLEAHGTQCVRDFNGMFAMVAWNRKNRSLHLIRDRYGIKPLYYWFDGKTLLVASEIKALLQHPIVNPEVHAPALTEYFTFQNLFRFHTLFKGIHLVPPANDIVVTERTENIVHHAWWDYDFTTPDESMTFDDAVMETRRLMTDAVEHHLISDVPVGCYLSGGMDTGAIAAIASNRLPRLPTFTGGFDLSLATGFEANFDERREAELTAVALQSEHYERVFFASDIEWSLPRVVYHLEDLRMGMTGTLFYMAQLASKFVTVVLSGTGGDELFGGYPWRYYRVFRSLDADEFYKEYYGFWQRMIPASRRKEFFTASVLNGGDAEDPFDVMSRVFTFNDSLRYDRPEDHIANSLYFEAKTFLPGLLLVHDRLSAAHGLEERVPFLDNALVDFAMSVPVKHKLSDLDAMLRLDENEYKKRRKAFLMTSDGKNVLREAMRDLLPSEVVSRKKQGFSPPHGSWYRTEAAPYVERTLLGRSPYYGDFIDPYVVRNVVEEHNTGRVNHRLLIWSLLCFEHWCRVFLSGESPCAPSNQTLN